MGNGLRKAGIATATLAASGAVLTIGGIETASAAVPIGAAGTGTHSTSARTTSHQATHTWRATHTGRATTSAAPRHATTHTQTTTARTTPQHATRTHTARARTTPRHTTHTRAASASYTPRHAAPATATSTTPAKTSSSSAGQAALQYAKRQIGKSYQFGAAGPNKFDCSGLAMQAWEAAGVSLPHNTVAQFHTGTHVSRKNLQPGDLVFFYSSLHHVGIYAGNGKVVDAENPSTPVKVTPIDWMPYAGAVRPS